MNSYSLIKGKPAAVFCIVFAIVTCQATDYTVLKQQFDLAGERASQTQYYRMEHRFIHYQEDGTRQRVETFRCYLKAWPRSQSAEEYLCRKYTIQVDGQEEKVIPALTDWSYTFEKTKSGLDKKGRVFGIDHGKFEKLTDDIQVCFAQ